MGISEQFPIISRQFQSDDDCWKIRRLLDDTYDITPIGFNWEVRHWDGWRFYAKTSDWNSNWEKQVRV